MNEAELITFFKDIHAHPELGFAEKRTTAKVLKALRAHGIRTLDTGLPTGTIAVVGGRRPGRTIGLRCDMDALPIQEETGLDYASVNPGVMHACGHDAHTSIMLAAATLLKAEEDQLDGSVKIIFQPSEESANGASRVMATGLLDDVDEFYAVHCYPWFRSGTLGIREGAVMAAPDSFRIEVRGRGVHAAQPFKGVDPIPAAATIALAAQGILRRTVDPFSPAVLSVTHIAAGSTWNVLPDSALLEGTVRTLNPQDRERIRAELRQLSQSVAEAHGCTAAFHWGAGPAAVINDAALCDAARRMALEMGFRVERQEDTMGGEDFSVYLEKRPGAFLRVGTGGGYPSHHAKYCVDPSALWPAARFFARLAMERARP